MVRETQLTGKENSFPPSSILLSTTDLKGKVTYANKDFCAIAGYDIDELVGHGHNIVRHPDMPKAAFEDLWSTIKQGKSWMGPVKNRCKNGDHYWVNGYVTPIKNDSGKIVEYQSVRSTLDKEVAERAEKLYQQINSNNTPKKLKVENVDVTKYVQWLLIAITLFTASTSFFTETPIFVSAAISTLLLFTLAIFSLWRTRYNKVVQQAEQVFDNPLMSYLYSGSVDKLGRIDLALKMRKAEITAVVGRVKDVSLHVGNIAHETASNGNDVSKMLCEQNMEIEQVATAMDQMSTTIQELSSSVTDAADASSQSLAISNQGLSVVDETISAIQTLSNQLQEVEAVIQKLASGRNSIATISDEISSIADQTNLLALNAAIEAARAGEQGRGFAVVAEEVRALALRTQQSTEEIQNTLSSLNQESIQAVSAIHQGVEQVEQCIEHANNSGETLGLINGEVDKVSSLNLQIATAVEEQSVVSEQVNKNTTSIRDIANVGVQHGQQSEQLGDKLIDELNILHSLINQFSLSAKT